MTAETIHVSNCPTCGHFPTQHIGSDALVREYRALTLPPASDAGEDTARLDWLLGRMSERQINEVLGGTHRAIFTIACARAAIDAAKAAQPGRGGEG